ncbi:hypothetical protein [Enhygromyxa salina]|uniref:Uncharacterized protein n=1 Tax=Enhygromyxa salina TaxID=215803 RepID=A0A2S9YC35_9BACT|nr:hypothetical protein [Enhygromyxa salina]PRQ02670.1 hypothetical protein ENSA7_54990 [Enhygromyxa salina]
MTFKTPACQSDFTDASSQAQLDALWDTNLQGFTSQGQLGNPWTATYASNQNWYFNPTIDDTSTAVYAPILWSPLPGRIRYYFRAISPNDIYSLADTGYDTKGNTFGQITKNPCDTSDTDTQAYGPYGPRGWQDEYCEWAITRNAENQITRIDFTCENPEYWNSLWMISPERVAELYRGTLDKPQIRVEDLYLYDATRQVVIDPSTGRPAYNPLNKWNSGTSSSADAGGAMHLTSTPNTLQTETGLAAAATIPRTSGSNNAGTLICCAQYGQSGRNSDPHIGQSVNQTVTPSDPARHANKATLANPPGLYIQQPNFSRITAPDGTDPSTFWTVKRGTSSLTDGRGRALPGNFILHATFEVPASFDYTISNLEVDGAAVQWAAQIAQTFNMQIAAQTLPQTSRLTAQPCVGTASPRLAQPLQMFHTAVFNAMLATSISNPVGASMNLASNSTLVAPWVAAGSEGVALTLVLTGIDRNTAPTIDLGAGITVKSRGVLRLVNYTIPGNSYPSDSYALDLTIDVASYATKGLRGVNATNPNQAAAASMPALLNII